MTPTMRKALYGLIPLVVAALTAYGIFTDDLGVLWGNAQEFAAFMAKDMATWAEVVKATGTKPGT